MSSLNLSVIIVNWNSADYLRQCLESIYAETHGMLFEIIVVDNASFDGCDELLKNHFPDVRFIQSRENIGFARANNLGSEQSSGRNLLFLNPDTVILDGAIDAMYSVLESTPDAGAVGCRNLKTDLTLDPTCVRPFPFLLNSLVESQYLITRFPRARLWASNPLFSDAPVPRKVDVVIGACIMIRREVFTAIGMFSTEYFMYSEDVDLCFKVNQAGWNTYYVSNASIIHHGGGSTKNKTRNDFKQVMIQESRYRFIRKMKGTSYALLFRFCTAISGIFRLILIMVSGMGPRDGEKKKAWKLSYYKWKKIVSWSMGLEGWVNGYYDR